MTAFQEFPKIARYSRDCIVTEKIDGTNASVVIEEPDESASVYDVMTGGVVAADRDRGLLMYAGSRTRHITPEQDNHGFARWVKENAETLWALGPGRHFGEWWGSGIQRGYGLPKGEKRFSLFNVTRWALHGTPPLRIRTADPRIEKYQDVLPPCVGLVPELWRGQFDELFASALLEKLAQYGSQAAPGFMKPEGIVIFHVAGNYLFKKTIEKDTEPKSMAGSSKVERAALAREVAGSSPALPATFEE